MIIILCICYKITPSGRRITPQFSINTGTFCLSSFLDMNPSHFRYAHFSRQSDKTTYYTTKLTNYNLPCGISPSLFVLNTSQIKENGKKHYLSYFINKSSVISLTSQNMLCNRCPLATSIHDTLN